MRIKKIKEIGLNPFREVIFDFKSAETDALILVCGLVFSAAFFAGGWTMAGCGQKSADVFGSEKVLAAENQADGISADAAGSEDDISLQGRNVSEAMSGAAGSVKNSAAKAARARKIARERAAHKALLRNTPVPQAPTKRVNGKRVCEKKNDKPHDSAKTNKPHMDMECCPDPDEWPNPHCYYTPEQISRMLKPPR